MGKPMRNVPGLNDAGARGAERVEGSRAPAAACTLTVAGMDCSSCADSIDRALHSLDGVHDVRVDVMGGKVTVRYASDELDRADLAAAVTRIGYRVEPPSVDRATGPAAEVPWWRGQPNLVLAAVSGLLWAGSLLADLVVGVDWLAAPLAIGAIVSAGWYIVPRGIRAAMNRALDMNFLMSLAAFGALIIGEYAEAASAMFLFAVAQLLESRSMDRARHAIQGLMDLSPAEATVLRSGVEERVAVERVMVGDVVVVRPGEKIPVDGLVVSGRSTVNQAPITGESLPVEKDPGAEIFAGTLNGEGALEVRSTKPAADTTLARIIHSVEEAQASRAPSQTFVDRFARVYTPAVVIGAVLVAVIPPLVGFGTWTEWLYRALVLLVVACPCALVISTPVTVVSALAGAARRGILIKGGLHLENAGRVRVIAFDKTGTLTRGEPAVVDVLAVGGLNPAEVLALAAAAEARSEHPLARAVLRRAHDEGLRVDAATETSALPGRGLRARVGTATVYVGSERLFSELAPLEEHVRSILARHEAAGRTAVLVGSAEDGGDPIVQGVLAISDPVRPQASTALRELHRSGVRRTVMLTGDNAGTAQAVAEALGGAGVGVDEVRAGLLPAQKVAAVKELERSHGLVAMVGDGINDAPALAAASLGIAMGSAGTDVALETADIALMADDLSKLSTTIRIARKAEGIIRANIYFSLLTKAAFVVLAVLGLATLWMAVLADMGASLLVVANGLRALRD